MEYKNLTENDEVWVDLKKEFSKDQKEQYIKEDKKLLFINAVLYLLSKKKPYSLRLNWQTLPPEYGNWDSQRYKFNRWREEGTWEKLLPLFVKRTKYRWIVANGTYEVFLKDSKDAILVRDINLMHKQVDEITQQVKEEELKNNYAIKFDEVSKKLSKHKEDIKVLHAEIASLKSGAEINKLKQQIENLTIERNKYVKKSVEFKENNTLLRKILGGLNYVPGEAKRSMVPADIMKDEDMSD